MTEQEKLYKQLFDSGYECSIEDAQPKWISVKDRLPEDDRNVLVYDDHDIQFWVAWHDESNNKWYTQEGDRVYGVTHWMPLPKLPEGE